MYKQNDALYTMMLYENDQLLGGKSSLLCVKPYHVTSQPSRSLLFLKLLKKETFTIHSSAGLTLGLFFFPQNIQNFPLSRSQTARTSSLLLLPPFKSNLLLHKSRFIAEQLQNSSLASGGRFTEIQKAFFVALKLLRRTRGLQTQKYILVSL